MVFQYDLSQLKVTLILASIDSKRIASNQIHLVDDPPFRKYRTRLIPVSIFNVNFCNPGKAFTVTGFSGTQKVLFSLLFSPPGVVVKDLPQSTGQEPTAIVLGVDRGDFPR